MKSMSENGSALNVARSKLLGYRDSGSSVPEGAAAKFA
jgi:hypothetical protein